ncbi:MAG: hypothetical protein K940chlam7_00387 [Chlamydiae bacterium]|nr:hypothetical protein [Chlamydiota bacterium]
MVYNNNFTIGELTGRQYSQLMSPSRVKRDKNGTLTERKVTWIRHAFKHVIVFINRLFHAIFHKDHRWENDKTLLHRFTEDLKSQKPVDKVSTEAIKMLNFMDVLRMNMKEFTDLYLCNKHNRALELKITRRIIAAEKRFKEGEKVKLKTFKAESRDFSASLDNFKNETDRFKKINIFKDAVRDEDVVLGAISLLGRDLILRNRQNTQEVHDHLQLHIDLQSLKKIHSPAPIIERADTAPSEEKREDLPTQNKEIRAKWWDESNNDQNPAYKEVKTRERELEATMELYRRKVEEDERIYPKRHLLVEKCVKEGKVIPTRKGCGAAIFLEWGGKTEFVVKANGEGARCLHCRKRDDRGNLLNGYSINGNSRIRLGVPLGFEPTSELLFREVAESVGLGKYVPVTFPAIITSKEFFDRAEDPNDPQPKTKSCSAQQFVKNKGDISDLVKSDDAKKRTKTADEKEQTKRLRFHTRFEDIDPFSVGASIFLDCLCGNTDRHADNCLIGTKNELVNIDNGLCFPENNYEICSFNVLLPQAEKEFDSRFRNLIERIGDKNSPFRQRLIHLIKKTLMDQATVIEEAQKKPAEAMAQKQDAEREATEEAQEKDADINEADKDKSSDHSAFEDNPAYKAWKAKKQRAGVNGADKNEPSKNPFFERIFEKEENARKKKMESKNEGPKNCNVEQIIEALEKRIEVMHWAIGQGMSMKEVGLRVFALESKNDEFVFRNDPITEKDIDSRHLGLEDIKKQWTVGDEEEKEEDGDHLSGTLVSFKVKSKDSQQQPFLHMATFSDKK